VAWHSPVESDKSIDTLVGSTGLNVARGPSSQLRSIRT